MSFFTALAALFVAFNFLMVAFALVLGYLEWRATKDDPAVIPPRRPAPVTPG